MITTSPHQTAQSTEGQQRSVFFETMYQNSVFPYFDSALEEKIQTKAQALQQSPGVMRSKNEAHSPQDSAQAPISNRGVKFQDIPERALAIRDAMGFSREAVYEPYEGTKVFSLGKAGKMEFVRVPSLNTAVLPNYALIDWINFTFKIDSYSAHFLGNKKISNDHLVCHLSSYLFDILGYCVTSKRDKGLYFYHDSYELGFNGWGRVMIGGQNDTLMVELKGQGLLAARPGWEHRLYAFLMSIPYSKITRIDLAHDSFESKTSLDDYFQMYLADLFTTGGMRPSATQHGDWVNANEKGRTFEVGKRISGKMLRIYEKGLKLGKYFSGLFKKWIRVELELHSGQREIPLEILLKPGQYLAGAYPALASLQHEQCVISTKKNTQKTLVDKAIEVTRHQFGKYIYFICGMFGLEEAFKILTHGKDDLPKKLNFADYISFSPEHYLSTQDTVFQDRPEFLGNSFIKHDDFLVC